MWKVLCFLLGVLALSQSADTNAAVSKQVSDASNSFSLDLFKTVLDEKDGNVVVSPVSVSTLLSLVQQGAGGETQTQLTKVLHVDQDQSRQGYSQLTKNLKETSGNLTLEFANAAFLNKGYTIRPTFKSVLENDFQATTETVDFSEADAAAKEINSWVADHTHNKIQNLVSPDALDAQTRAVLVNAIYFKDFWKKSFEKKLTKQDDFYTKVDSPKKVSTMHLETRLLTGELQTQQSRWVQLPFQGDRFYMLVILPNERDGLNTLLQTLDNAALSDLIENVDSRGYEQLVELSMPKFTLKTTTELVPTLQKLGLTDIFSNANLTGISEEPVAVSQVIQKAQIEVDEEGATAAAATAIIGFGRAPSLPPPPPLPFIVDHPFVAFIVDGLNELPLFACRVSDPTTS